jgi:K+-transporting ATPase KdpF subunit
MNVEFTIALAVVIILFGYLAYVMAKPERF